MCKRVLYHLTEMFCILSGQSEFRSPGFSAGLALDLLLIFLLIFHLHENNTDFTSITHMQLAFTCDRTFRNLLCWPSRLLFWPPGTQEWSGQENCLFPSAVHSLQCRYTVCLYGRRRHKMRIYGEYSATRNVQDSIHLHHWRSSLDF